MTSNVRGTTRTTLAMLTGSIMTSNDVVILEHNRASTSSPTQFHSDTQNPIEFARVQVVRNDLNQKILACVSHGRARRIGDAETIANWPSGAKIRSRFGLWFCAESTIAVSFPRPILDILRVVTCR